MFRCGIALALPLFPLYWVRELQLLDSHIGLINTVQNAVLLGAYFMWSELSRRRGSVLVLRLCAFGLVLHPLLTGLTSSVPALVVYAAMAGIFTAGLDLVLFDILLATCPQRHTASYIALYQTTTYVATFAAPILGTVVAEALGYAPALFISSGLRFAERDHAGAAWRWRCGACFGAQNRRAAPAPRRCSTPSPTPGEREDHRRSDGGEGRIGTYAGAPAGCSSKRYCFTSA